MKSERAFLEREREREPNNVAGKIERKLLAFIKPHRSHYEKPAV